jgi:Dolichyl-phosphate-mannose-protein mannosyltransferase
MRARFVAWLSLNGEEIAGSIYALALLAAFSVWFLAIRAPLWLDETGSYWNISGGFRQIWARSAELNSFPAYYYVLWITNAIFGGKEIVLRIPSVLAMLAATYVFYRCARELFVRDVALIATVLFILNRRIVFAAIDVRPYAFGILLTNLAILSLLRWANSSSHTKRLFYSAMLGVTSAGIFYFHYLYGCMVAAFLIICLVDGHRRRSIFAELPQLGIAAGCFGLLMIPVLPRLWYLHQTRNTHIFAEQPPFRLLPRALSPGVVGLVFVAVVVLAALMHKLLKPDDQSVRQIAMCATLAVVPLVILYVISVATPLHVFIDRYEGVAVPGIALSWAWIFSLINSRWLRLIGCIALVAWSAGLSYSSPTAHTHKNSWKYALQFADDNAAPDGAPLVICSDLPEADFQPMPAAPLGQSVLFATLGYYPVRATVIPMPRTLNTEAQLIGARFIQRAGVDHQRFLALGFIASYPTLDWLASQSSDTYVSRVLGDFDDVKVVEFVPRDISRGH